MKKRICIFPIFCKDKIVDSALLFFLDSLNKVVDRLIIPVIGELGVGEINKIQDYTKEILWKNNEGLDASAVKYVFKHYLSLSELNEYDELIIANDTNFGPFVSFLEIFGSMDNVICDFWGMNLSGYNLLVHLQSDFRVFKRKCFSFLINYILENIDEHEQDKTKIVLDYEVCLHKRLVDAGFSFSSYVQKGDPLNSPYVSLIKGHPFLKVRSFFYQQEEFYESLRLISVKYDYNVNWIVCRMSSRYGIQLPQICFPLPNRFFSISESEFERFITKNENLWIYGLGYLKRFICSYYKPYLYNLKGFIVSDKESVKSDIELPVYSVSEFNQQDAAIIIAMNKNNTQEVLPLLSKYSNILDLYGLVK